MELDLEIYTNIFLYWCVNQISSNEHVFWMIASMIYAFLFKITVFLFLMISVLNPALWDL